MSDLVLADPGATPGSLITEDTQIEWRGMLMGAGSFCGYKGLSGWEDLAGLDSTSVPIPRSHGVYPGILTMNEKVVTFESQLYPPTTAIFKQLLDALRARLNVRDAEAPLFIRQHGETLMAFARVTGRTLPIDRKYFQGYPVIRIQWTLSDPRRYSVDEKTALVVPVVTEGGLDWDGGLPWDVGLDWGDTVSGGSPVVENDGTTDSPPVIEFVGPLSGPFTLYCEHWSLGYNLTLTDGQIMTVDTRKGTSMLNGQDRLFNLTNSSHIPEDCVLPPGTTTFTLQTANSDDTGSARVIYRDALD